ncbi:hypothetical protein D3N41_003967 [Escherichia coli]|nr:hypothetical protein [Escherichia coli]
MRIRYGWELALAALLVIEIVAFGAINPRMLDLNMWGSDQFWAELVQSGRTCKPCVARGVVI